MREPTHGIPVGFGWQAIARNGWAMETTHNVPPNRLESAATSDPP